MTKTRPGPTIWLMALENLSLPSWGPKIVLTLMLTTQGLPTLSA